MLGSFQRVLVLTAVLTAVFVGSAVVVGGWDGTIGAGGIVIAAANTLPLLAVRRHPLGVVAAFAIAYPTWVATDHPTSLLQSLPTFVAMYATGAWSRPLWIRSLALISPIWMLAAALVGWWQAVDPVELGLELGYVAVMFVVVWGLGVVVADRRRHSAELERRTAQLEERTTQLEEARRELADRAVADERARIARELHDVIAHAMSVITVRAAVAAHLADDGEGTDPETIEALRVIEGTGREALDEMRRMLIVLRRTELPDDPQQPQPGVRDLPELVARAGAAGVQVTHRTEGTPHPLSAGLDLAVYRVVQEALTNVVKHAPGTTAAVTLRYHEDEIAAEVSNHGAAAPEPVTPGQGLRGMAERVALYAGTFDAAPLPDGFRVLARFPLGSP